MKDFKSDSLRYLTFIDPLLRLLTRSFYLNLYSEIFSKVNELSCDNLPIDCLNLFDTFLLNLKKSNFPD